EVEEFGVNAPAESYPLFVLHSPIVASNNCFCFCSTNIKIGADNFSGNLSLVEFWCRELSIEEDIAKIIDAKNTEVEGGINNEMRRDWAWGSYSKLPSSALVTYLHPSSRGINCQSTEQLQSAECVPIPGKFE
ncbi:MAG: hypothetical protein V2I33_22310, partial [Kangiellaceae bacterium]|nr:hypothetical protein [Kangiellaceae bacterium]